MDSTGSSGSPSTSSPNQGGGTSASSTPQSSSQSTSVPSSSSQQQQQSTTTTSTSRPPESSSAAQSSSSSQSRQTTTVPSSSPPASSSTPAVSSSSSQPPPASSQTTPPAASSSVTSSSSSSRLEQSSSYSSSSPSRSSSGSSSSSPVPSSSSTSHSFSSSVPSSSSSSSSGSSLASSQAQSSSFVPPSSNQAGASSSATPTSAGEALVTSAASLVDPSVHTHTETSEYTLTSSGKIVVVTSVFTAVVTGDSSPSGSGVPRLNNANGSGNAFFSNTGAVAGTFVGVGIVAAATVAFLFFFFVRRKRRRQLDEDIRVATGGAGDGGAGFSRFNDDDDDEESFTGGGTRGSVGHLSSTTRMSSYGNVPLTAAAAGPGTRHSSGYDVASSTNTTPGVWEPSATGFEHLPTSSPGQSISSLPQMQQAYFGYGPSFASFAAGGPRSQEGVMHDDWQDDAAGAGLTVPTASATMIPGYEPASRAGSGEGSPGDSQEGMMGSTVYTGEGRRTPNKRDSGMSFYPEEAAAADQRGAGAFRNSVYGSSDGHGSSMNPYGGLAPPERSGPSSPRIDDRLNPNAFASLNNHSATSLADENDYSRPILR
ncbi:hypothetical protein JCM10908_000257 [Rhodotorula pacifica]|uniref:uncharacterized protein n=1 Tax=Rhodotorula pacifica TaxID=1495444 RepID=UPI00317ED1CC